MRTQIWSCGGGVQSAAIAALIVTGKLPKPDLAAIVDTGRERSSTWDYFNFTLEPGLSRVGVKLNRIYKSEYATVDLVSSGGSILLPGFTNINGKIGKLPGYCSNEWKARPLQRWARKMGVKQADCWLGISTDEMKRVRQSEMMWWQKKYPLIFEVPMSRQQCIDLVKSIGWPEPPRSSCWMCPNMGKHEWESITDYERQQADQLQRELQEIDPYFSLRPPNKDAEKEGSCMEGMCFV